MHSALHGADADAQFGGDLLDTFALSTRRSDAFLDDLGRARPAERLALCPRALDAGANALADHRAFELGKYPAHLERRLAGRGRGVDALLMQIQIDRLGLQVRKQRHELLQRPPHPTDQASTRSILRRVMAS
jgi:hypothetical protein